MRQFVIITAAIAAYGHPLTSNAQSDGPVLIDVDSCIELPTRAEQLECYEQRVNEALAAQGGADASNASEPAAAETREADSAPELSRAERRAERREAREAERRAREIDRRQQEAAEAAARAEEAALAAAEAAAAVEDDSFTPGEIVARIVDFREIEPNAYIITLDNGQVWRQSTPRRYNLIEGAEVRLRPTRYGPSYRLTDPNVGSFIQVRRID